MFRGLGQRLLTLLVLAATACGRPAPPKVAPPPPPVPERLSGDLEASLAALSLPEDLLVAARWRSPGGLLAQLDLAPEALAGALSFEGWLRSRLGEASRPIDFSSPLELLVVVNRSSEQPRLDWALSVGLRGPGGPEPGPEPREVASPAGLACAESRALGSSGARLVCAAGDAQLAALLPHATRSLPLARFSEADVALIVRSGPLAALGPEGRRRLTAGWLAELIGEERINDRFVAQRSRLVDGLALELGALLEELDGASLELELDAREQALELSLLAPAATGRSALGRLLVGSGSSGLAPTEFWQLDHASEGAGFLWALDATPLARFREPLAALLGTLLDYRGVPARLGQQARELVLYLPVPRGPVIHASGRLPPASGREPRAARLERLGWQLWSVRGNFIEYQHYGSALAASFNDPILGPQFARLLRAAFGAEWAPTSVVQRRPRFGNLPRDSFVLQVGFPAPRPGSGEPLGAASKTPAAPPQWFAVFVPDEDGVRIACGADERHVVSLLVPRSRAQALAARAGLGSLNEHRLLAGGFVSLAGLRASAPGLLDLLSLSRAPARPIESSPHRGSAPIVYALSQPNEAWVHLTARVGRDALEDVLYAIGAAPPQP